MPEAVQEHWDELYRSGFTPWKQDEPTAELIRMVDEEILRPCRAVELGCGSGTNAVFLAQQGFEVTAIDFSAEALKRARSAARSAGVSVRFLQADVCRFAEETEPFEFLFERSCYDFARRLDFAGYRDAVLRLSRRGSHSLLLCGNSAVHRQGGPPGVSEAEIRADWEDLFEIRWLYPLMPDARRVLREAGRWSCLMVRR